MAKTKIAWTDATWSPVTGCTKISAGCTNCYAERMARRLAGRCGYPEAPHHFDVRLHPDRLLQPLRWKKPRRVFVCSMSDFFHPMIPLEFQVRAFLVMRQCPQHTFQVLTKRSELMAMMEYAAGIPMLENLWLGVTTENQEQADRRIPDLLRTQAAVRFVSVEPMLGSVDAWQYLGAERNPIGLAYGSVGVDWLIIGCESGPNRRPMELEWAINLVRQCDAAGVATFVKQIPINGRVSHDLTEWPAELQRREYPK